MTGTLRLLAIDDNADSAELIVRIATKCGCEAQAVSQPAALVGAVGQWKPDIITLDLCMPGEDGIAVLMQLKNHGFNGQLVIVSGQDEWLRKAAGRLAIAHGLRVVADFPKPIEVGQFRKLLSSAALREDTSA